MTSGLSLGKVPPQVLERLLASAPMGEDVLVGPGVGLDAAVVAVGGVERLVVASDPITFAADEIGWYAVHVNANDVACMGGVPRWFFAVVLLAPGMTEADAERIFEQIGAGCREVGAVLAGGHTEVTPGLAQPIVVGTMLGTAVEPVSAAGGRPGDVLLLTKGIAIEATAILARERADVLRPRVSAAVLERARAFLREPGLSVVADARTALAAGGVHALHDPTEGGLIEGIRELCTASGVGAYVCEAAIPVFEETRLLAEPFGIDPLGVIASGALLIAVDPGHVDAVRSALAARSIACAEIGRLLPAGESAVLERADGSVVPLPRFNGDEIGKIFA